jgi:hypothetical protein
MTSLHDFWPTPQGIAECIRTEAEVVDDAVLMAVHEPGTLIRRSANGGSERTGTEKDLLQELMRDASDGSAVLVAITGDSGVGKSHLVRWLHAQLLRHPRRDQLVIIVVPKTASLRHVVERILKPLDGDTYERLLSELNQTVDHFQPRDAAKELSTKLHIALNNKFKEGNAALRTGQLDNQAFRTRLHLTGDLALLLREPDVFDYWLGGVLERIVRQTIQGGSEQQAGEQRQFVPEDLEAPEAYPEITKQAVRKAKIRVCDDDGGTNRAIAAEILQEVLDPALRDLFKFSQALGQQTIEDIVDGIRRQLLVDGKELVLLVEDFAALSGIQQPLLNLMIAESDHAGVRVRAPIRTALAVTEGFLPSRQTILTRAKEVWLIPNSSASSDAIIDRLISLAGRYLNAARWGAAALRKQFNASVVEGVDGWVQPFLKDLTDDEVRMLRAFGECDNGYPLFPLSRLAIERIAKRELSVGGELRFNPRAFINVVLRETLDARPLFERKTFPPAGFKKASARPEVQIALGTRGFSAEVRGRLATVLDYWAGNPMNFSDTPLVERGLFDAFNLPWPFVETGPDVAAAIPVPTVKISKDPRLETSPPPPEISPLPPSSGIDLDAWDEGKIDQSTARQIRNLLASALKSRIDWSMFRLQKKTTEAAQLWLPFARVGNPSTEPKFVVGEETLPLDYMLIAGVRALDRWNSNKQSWNYERSEDDYAVAQILLDRIEAQVVEWHLSNSQKQAGVTLKILHRQALMLRLSRSAEPESPQLSQYFAELRNPLWDPKADDNRPAAGVARQILLAEKFRVNMQNVFADTVGCYQGEGSILMGIDSNRTQAAWRMDASNADASIIGAQLGEARAAADSVLTRIEPLILNKLVSTIKPAYPRIRELLKDVKDVNMATALLEPLELARKYGLFRPNTVGTFEQAKRYVDALSTERARQLIDRAMSFVEPHADTSVENQLLVWSTLDLEQIDIVNEALSFLERLIGDLERAANTDLTSSGGADISSMLSALKSDLQEIVKEKD